MTQPFGGANRRRADCSGDERRRVEWGVGVGSGEWGVRSGEWGVGSGGMIWYYLHGGGGEAAKG